MRNTGYNKLQLVLVAVKDWGNFLKLGEILQKASRKNTVYRAMYIGAYRSCKIIICPSEAESSYAHE